MKKDQLLGQIHQLLDETLPKEKPRFTKPLLFSLFAGGIFAITSVTMAVQAKAPPSPQTSSDRVLNHLVSQIKPVKYTHFTEVGDGLYLMNDGFVVALRVADPI